MNQSKLTLTAALASLAVTACQQTTTSNEMANDTPMANVDVATVPPDDTAGNADVAMNNSMANGTVPAKLPTSIPVQFHGRWGINRADCTSTRGDAKGLLTINDARLTFYESKGTLDKVLGATANSFDARYGFSGEGQTWQRTERLTLAGGKLQRRTDAEPGQEPPVNLSYSRC